MHLGGHVGDRGQHLQLGGVLALRRRRRALLFLAVWVASLAQHDGLGNALMLLLRLRGAVRVLAALVHAPVRLDLGARFLNPTCV